MADKHEEVEEIHDGDDVLRMLDGLLRDEAAFWDDFYEDRERPIPFFPNRPDENLVAWFDEGALQPGRVLELGCGPGRNALYMAGRGCEVHAVDLSATAIGWARERAREADLTVTFLRESIFDFTPAPGAYDIVYDAGCLHHVPPHRRRDYFDFVKTALAPQGRFSLVIFRPEGGSGQSDWQVYRDWSMKGGLGFEEDFLRRLLARHFEILDLRPMQEQSDDAPTMGVSFCWVVLMKPIDR